MKAKHMLAMRHAMLVTPQVVAEIEGVSVYSVLNWCRQGRIYPAAKIANNWFINESYIIERRKRGRPFGATDSFKRNRRWRNRPVEDQSPSPGNSTNPA